MNQPLPSYPDYKPAGLPWLAQVPAHWEIKRAKQVFRTIDQRSETGLEEKLTVSSKNGVVPRREQKVTMFMAASYVGHKLCWPGDLVVNSLWAWANGLGFAKHHGIISTAYSVYRPLPEYAEAGPYLDYLLRSSAFQWEFQIGSKGIWISRLQLTDDTFMRMPMLLPPLPEQQRIVAFLDAKGRQIARLLRNKRQLIKLLTEQKQALIHRAVTQGLDADAPRKESGVAWLGAVPAHWEVKRLKKVVELNPSKKEATGDAEKEKQVVFLPMENVSTEGEIDCSLKLPVNAVSNGFTYFRRNDIIVAKITPCFENGKGACVDKLETEFGFGSTEFIVLRPNREILPAYLYLITAAPMFRILGADNMTGAAGQQRVSTDFVRDFQTGIPPIDEQVEILKSVASTKAIIDRTISRAEREIGLIQEYRTRLVADVVTGRVDVRQLADLTDAGDEPAETGMELEDEESEEELAEAEADE